MKLFSNILLFFYILIILGVVLGALIGIAYSTSLVVVRLDRLIELQKQQVCCDPLENPDLCTAACCGGEG